MGKILLVEPNFPFPNKSKNRANTTHKNFVPLGLLKIGAMHKRKGDHVHLVRGNVPPRQYVPKKIYITSLFTYWSKYVWDSIIEYRKLFPNSEIIVGGIYVTLFSNNAFFLEKLKKYNIQHHSGLYTKAENYMPDYNLIGDIDYHATHMMRGCKRKCKFCGTWILEPSVTYKNKKEILEELTSINKNHVIFYDNNILDNPNIKNILLAFIDLKINGKVVYFESQSGFDGRILERDKMIATLLKKARFTNIKIAWDNSISDEPHIKKQISLLEKAGYKAKDISIFILYNYDITYQDVCHKLKKCKEWGVQVNDCRYRPLDAVHDNYNPRKKNQNTDDYYIHEKADWTDNKIKMFRKKVREHNIEIRYIRDKNLKYNKKIEKWSAINNTFKFFDLGIPPHIKTIENNNLLKCHITKLNHYKNKLKKQGYTKYTFITDNTQKYAEIVDICSKINYELNKK